MMGRVWSSGAEEGESWRAGARYLMYSAPLGGEG